MRSSSNQRWKLNTQIQTNADVKIPYEVNTTHLLNDGMIVLRVGQVLEGLEGGPLGRLVALLDHVEVLAGAEHGGRVLLQKARDLVQPETAVSVRVNKRKKNYQGEI